MLWGDHKLSLCIVSGVVGVCKEVELQKSASTHSANQDNISVFDLFWHTQ